MRAPVRIAAVVSALLMLACDEFLTPNATGGLVLHVQRASGAAAAAAVDSGHVVVSGPTNKTVKVLPAQTVTIDGLTPGAYSVSVEAFSAGGVTELGKATNVSVAKGQSTAATVILQSLPALLPLPLDVTKATTATLKTGAANPPATLTYTWTQVSGPTGAWSGPLSGAAPTFTAPNDVATLQYQLVVSDGVMSSPPQTVTIWVLEDAVHALWVAPTGDNSKAGTRQAPMATIQAAIDRLNTAGTGGGVYVVAGTYAQSLTLQPKVSVFGGFNPTTFLRDIAANGTIVSGGPTAVTGNGANSLTLDGLTIQSADAPAGGSSVGIALSGGTGVVINRNMITAGKGAAGSDGSVGSAGINGASGAGSTAAGTGSGALGGAPVISFCRVFPVPICFYLNFGGGSGGDGGTTPSSSVCSPPGGNGLPGQGVTGGGGGGGGGAFGGNGGSGVNGSTG